MSQMKELYSSIEEVCVGNDKLKAQVIEEIDLHINGLLPFGEMSMEAQRAVEIFETQNSDQIHYEGDFGYPGADEEVA